MGNAITQNAADESAETIVRLARALVAKLHLIHQDEGYQGIWFCAANHGVHYSGPKYEKELKQLDAALQRSDNPLTTQPASSDSPKRKQGEPCEKNTALAEIAGNAAPKSDPESAVIPVEFKGILLLLRSYLTLGSSDGKPMREQMRETLGFMLDALGVPKITSDVSYTSVASASPKSESCYPQETKEGK